MSRESRRFRRNLAESQRPAAFPRVLATSAEKGTGIPELRAEIAHACMV